MEYICLDCGYRWTIRKFELMLNYRACPKCRGYDTVPASFEKMVEVAERLGINDNTPLIDILNAFQAVWGHESLLELGFREFRRVMRRVIKEVEKRRRGG
jgi:hypothetical protein